MAEKMVLIFHIYFNKICVALWCSGQGVACKGRWTEFYSRRRWFLLLCAVLFFFLFSIFLIHNPFLLFSFILTAHPADHALGSIYILSLRQRVLFQKVLICILAKLTARKKHKLSRHVPPLKQLYFSLDVSCHPWQTTHSTDTTNCTNLH